MDGNARVLGVVKRALTEQAIAALETPSGRAPSWLTPVVTRNSVGGLDLYPHSLYWGTPQRAGPKSSDQWCEERSAMETAKCWLAARPALPPEVSAVLASHPAFGIVSEWEAELEARLSFDDLPGEPRNADLAAPRPVRGFAADGGRCHHEPPRLKPSRSAALATWRSTEMDALQNEDVPYGNDWDSATEAAAYGEAADQARPWRCDIRDHIAARVATLAPRARVLELGSGPGLLAHRVLQRCPNLETYTLMDFSEPMLALSRQRLAAFPAASFVLASFKSEDWTRRLEGRFDCVVSMQAVHELRHKRHAQRLYEDVYQVLAVAGLVLLCDHTPFDDSPKSIALYMTEQEQQQALADARFANVHTELAMNGLMLYAGEKST